jgi:DNA-binding response OmpR family regulator/Tfp pilus assembly protein PilZ
VPGELQTQLAGDEGVASAACIDVALSGIFVPTLRPHPVGTVLTLRLKMSKNVDGLETLARVAYVVDAEHASAQRGQGMGLEFLDVWGSRETEQVTHYLSEIASSILPAPMKMSGMSVLVVDDDARYLEHAAEVMREAGFEVLTASSGFAALSLAIKHQPSLVLTDVTMPNMDGWQLLRLIRAHPSLRRTPVVFLTALSNDADRLRGYQLGVDDYVAKPFTQVELTARVERVLERAVAADEAVANGMCGDLAKVPITSLLSLIEMEHRSGILRLARAGERATVYLRGGSVIRIGLAEPHDRLKGSARFFHVLDFREGRFELSTAEVFGDDELGMPTSFALLEYARIEDEGAAR